ncbi:MAG: hypothetical protein ACI9FJ_001249 [Alteromonadaceae bacterium]|jgi:hypothetical protein
MTEQSAEFSLKRFFQHNKAVIIAPISSIGFSFNVAGTFIVRGRLA